MAPSADPRQRRHLTAQFAGRARAGPAAAAQERRHRASRRNGRPFVALSLHPDPQVPE